MSSYIAAPLLVLTYGVLRIVDCLDGERGPGPAWTVGRLTFLFGQLTLVVLLALGRHVRPWTPLLVLADLAMPFTDKDLIPLGSGAVAGLVRTAGAQARPGSGTSAFVRPNDVPA